MRMLTGLRLFALGSIAATLAACGGGGALTPSVPTPASTPASSGTMMVLASSAGSLTVSGNIVALKTGGFQIQGGQGLGYYNVTTTSSTTFTGAKPYVGELVEISGTGSLSTSLSATSVTQMLQISGSVVALKSNGFQIQGGAGIGYVNIVTSASTVYSGGRPSVGQNVQVQGSGSIATSVNAAIVTTSGAPSTTSSPTPAPAATAAAATATNLLSASGPIVALKTGGFQIQAGAGIGYLNVWTNSSTVFSGTKPYVGENVKVTGTGSFTTALTAATVTQVTSTTTTAATPTPAPVATSAPVAQPAATAFMPSSWGKIAAMQVFDDTGNGYITQAAASADGWRYAAVWGSRNNIGTSWLDSNAALQTSYYNALETDESSTSWGAIGHTLSWWQSNHPDWVLYACTSAGAATTTPAWVPALNSNVPLDIHNPAVVQYQIRLMADYAHKMGYHALAIDEATFWQADEGVSGGYGCGIYQNGSFVRRYTGVTDLNWAADVVAWVKAAHAILTTDPTISTYHLKLIVNHPANQLSTNEQEFLANVDADLNENGYTYFGKYKTGSAASMVETVNWSTYAQKHGVAVLTDDNWGSNTVGTPQLDYSVATYLLGNEQAEALFASPGSGFGLEQWHSQYQTAVGAPCGEYYSAGDSSNPSIYYRRFANAIVVVNGGSGSNAEVARLPSGHTYTDLFGRAVTNPLTIGSNDGYVLLTSNGCN